MPDVDDDVRTVILREAEAHVEVIMRRKALAEAEVALRGARVALGLLTSRAPSRARRSLTQRALNRLRYCVEGVEIEDAASALRFVREHDDDALLEIDGLGPGLVAELRAWQRAHDAPIPDPNA